MENKKLPLLLYIIFFSALFIITSLSAYGIYYLIMLMKSCVFIPFYEFLLICVCFLTTSVLAITYFKKSLNNSNLNNQDSNDKTA